MMLEVTMRLNDITGKLNEAKRFATFAVSQQALKDCNYYCKLDTSALINSALIHSDLNGGVLRWVTPYAEYQYTLPNTRRIKNPNAGPEWCQTAQSNHHTQWKRVFEAAMREKFR